MEDSFSHPVISVSLYLESSFLTRVFKPKTLQLGMFTRKSPVLLKVQTDAVIENYNSKEIKFHIENLEFSLIDSKKNGRCEFVIRDQLLGLSRIYQVASFVELCWWFESFKRLKEKYNQTRNWSGGCSNQNPSIQVDGFAFIPKPKRLSQRSLPCTLVQETENFQSNTLQSLETLKNLKHQLQELKNSYT